MNFFDLIRLNIPALASSAKAKSESARCSAHLLGSVFTFACLLAVSPLIAQDRNTLQGDDAGDSVTTADDLSLFGYNAGFHITTSSRNTIFGSQAGVGIASTTFGIDNVIIGFEAALNSSTASDNVIIGTFAGRENEGDDNVFVGHSAGLVNTTGYDNTFVGTDAGRSHTTGYENTLIGAEAGELMTTGYRNTMLGFRSGLNSADPFLSTAIGFQSLYDNEGFHNTGIGMTAGRDIGEGFANTMIGALSGQNTEHADFNTFIGLHAGEENNRFNNTDTANRNVAIGFDASQLNRSGSDNAIIGTLTGNAYYNSSFYDPTSWVNVDDTNENASGFIRAGEILYDLDRNVALGSFSIIAGDDVMALGHDITIDQSSDNPSVETIVIGNGSSSENNSAFALGYETTTHGNHTFILGNASTLRVEPDSSDAATLGSEAYRFKNIVAASYTMKADSGETAILEWAADNAEDADDQWRMVAANGGDFSIQSFATSSYVDLMTITHDGDLILAGDIDLSSDARLKENIESIQNPFSFLGELEGKTYQWKTELGRGNERHYGLIAQEVEVAIPPLVSHQTSTGYLTVNYLGFVPVLVGAIQELAATQHSQSDAIHAEHQALHQQSAELAQLQQDMRDLHRLKQIIHKSRTQEKN